MKISKDSIIKNSDLTTRMKFLASDTIVYGVTSTLSKLTTLITFPLLARYFTVEEYGIINYYNIIIIFFSVFINFGLDLSIARYFVDCETDEEKKQLISQALLYQICLMLILFFVVNLVFDSFTGLLISNPDNIYYFKIALLQIPFLIVFNFTQNILKWTFEKYKFIIISVTFVVINLSLLVIFILNSIADVADIFIIIAFSTCVASLIGIFFIRKWFVLPKTMKSVLIMKSYFIPLGLASTAGAFFPYYERRMLLDIFDDYQLGLYAAGFAVANLISLFTHSFLTAWQPIAFSIYKERGAHKTYNVVLKLFVYCICICVFTIYSLGDLLILLFAGQKYNNASLIIFPISMSIAIQTISVIVHIGIALSKKTYLHLLIHVSYFAMISILIFVLAEDMGIYGIALSVLGASIFKAIVSFYLAQNVYHIGWECKKAFSLLLLTLILGILLDYLKYYMNWGGLQILGLLILSLLGWRFLFNSVEQEFISSYIKKKIKSLV